MARLYADEQFPRRVTELLRDLGHDVLTVQESGNAGAADEEVLAFAIATKRTVVTLNRYDFRCLHKLDPQHSGIILCTDEPDRKRMAIRINDAISGLESLTNQLIQVY